MPNFRAVWKKCAGGLVGPFATKPERADTPEIADLTTAHLLFTRRGRS
jgi:hypothetical protein